MTRQSLISALFTACILVAWPMTVRAQAPKLLKTWTFTLPHGTVHIDVEVYPDGTSRLGIGPSQEGNEAPVADEVQPLKQVLAEMLGLGADPRKLTYMDTRISSQDVRTKVAYACADSKECRFNMHSSEEREVEVLIDLLNQTGVYEPYNEAFKEYGIRVHATEAEGAHLIRFSTVPPRNAGDRANAKMYVLGGDTYIGMRFSRMDSTRR